MNRFLKIGRFNPSFFYLVGFVSFVLLNPSSSFAQVVTTYDDFTSGISGNWAMTTAATGVFFVSGGGSPSDMPPAGDAANAAVSCNGCSGAGPVTLTFTNTGDTSFKNFVAIDVNPFGSVKPTINMIVSDGTNSVTASANQAYFCSASVENPETSLSHSIWNTVFADLTTSGLTSISTVQLILTSASSLSNDTIYLDYLRASNTNPAVVAMCLTPTPFPTSTATFSPTFTRTPTPTLSPTNTLTFTRTFTPTVTLSPTFTMTPTPTVTLTATLTPTVTLTQTLVPTATATVTLPFTSTPSATFTITLSPTRTQTLTLTPTLTTTFSPTKTQTMTPTFTATIPPTATVTDTRTQTFTPTITNTTGPTATATPTCPSPLFPNPVDFQASHRPVQCLSGNCVVFDCLTSGSTLKIYTVSLALVREYDNTGATVTWDGLNGEANPVAAGIYFYTVQDPSGHRTLGKFAVARAKVNP